MAFAPTAIERSPVPRAQIKSAALRTLYLSFFEAATKRIMTDSFSYAVNWGILRLKARYLSRNIREFSKQPQEYLQEIHHLFQNI